MAHAVQDASLRTYMVKDRAKSIARQLNAAQRTGVGADMFKAVQTFKGGVLSEDWVIEVREDGVWAGWIKL